MQNGGLLTAWILQGVGVSSKWDCLLREPQCFFSSFFQGESKRGDGFNQARTLSIVVHRYTDYGNEKKIFF